MFTPVSFLVEVQNKGEEREQRKSIKRSPSGYEELEISITTKRPRLHQQNENQQVRNVNPTIITKTAVQIFSVTKLCNPLIHHFHRFFNFLSTLQDCPVPFVPGETPILTPTTASHTCAQCGPRLCRQAHQHSKCMPLCIVVFLFVGKQKKMRRQSDGGWGRVKCRETIPLRRHQRERQRFF